MSKVWLGEKKRFLMAVSFGLLAGWSTGYWLACVLCAVLIYLLWHLQQHKQLTDWLRRGANPKRAPSISGAWEPVVRYIYRIQSRHRRRKTRMRGLLKRFEKIAAALPDGTVVLRQNNEIDWASKLAADLLGVRFPEDSGHRIENLIRNPEFHAYMKAGDFSEPLNIPSPVSERIELSIRIIPLGEDEHLLAARDISTFMRVQSMRRDFVANVSHELRTPLTVINGYLETLLEDKNLGEETVKALSLINEQSGRMKNIVQDLLQLSRLESQTEVKQEEEVHLPSVLSALLSEWMHTAEKANQQFFTEINENLSVKGIEKELISLMSNLVHNALRHTPEGTEVRVKWYQNSLGAAVLEVEDNGPGIEAHHLPRLTERFYRVDKGRARAAGGSGLGLSIVNHIAQRHHARLVIDSAIGLGTRFSCIFPTERSILLPLPKRVQKK